MDKTTQDVLDELVEVLIYLTQVEHESKYEDYQGNQQEAFGGLIDNTTQSYDDLLELEETKTIPQELSDVSSSGVRD